MKDNKNNLSFITSNSNKFSEMNAFFRENGLEIEWLNRKLSELQADTLAEVVEYSLSKTPESNVFIEDAGFFIEALGGFPGVYSRYVYDTIGNKGILKLMEGVDNRQAMFEAVIGFKLSESTDIKLFKGEVKGYVSLFPKGENGFGYDPIFVPEGFKKTFAEDKILKFNISHRKRAAEKLINYLK